MRSVVVTAALVWAAPALAGQGPKESVAQALSEARPAQSSSAAGGSCCGGSGGSCGAAAQPGEDPLAVHRANGHDPYASEESWRTFVREVMSQGPLPETEPADADLFGFGVYRGVRPEPMGSQLVNGARMEIASLIVEEPPRVVTKFYLQSLEDMGIAPIQGQVDEVPGMTYLSFRPPGSKNLKTITLVPHGEGTVILASVGNPEELIQGRSTLPDGVPLPPKAELPSAIQQLEPGMSSRSTFFLVRESSVENVQSFYRKELLQRGFVAVSVKDGLPGMESYQKGNSLLAISAQAHTDPATVAVGLMWLDQ
ncbi:MAG TPA: hypothetical protein VFZ09_20245 [Archangium sp.]|uniref:hypothetical protein n=1 Tax=Archangium sp. TaxID=1872627 RepID=UPI002E3657EB|nr:hypothetical protein [Archangium sp.]HEX5748582.1 hypothetical protein [Archangium sp.]